MGGDKNTRPDMLFQPRSMSVVLVACGFNANGQLLPFTDTLERGPSHNIPDDITEPSIVASGNRTANVLFAGWSDTLLEIDDRLYLRGADAYGKQLVLELPKEQDPAHLFIEAFGDHTGIKGVLRRNKDVLFLDKDPESGSVELNPASTNFEDVVKITIAGNGKVCAVRDRNKVILWTNFDAFASQAEPEETFDLSNTTSEIIELDSNESAFTFLTTKGQVFTFGDPRHNNLGRSSEPHGLLASEPNIVDALDGVPIAHISSGGWITAALSKQKDLYIWGGRAGDEELVEGLSGLEGGDVSLVDLADGLDVKDIAVGAGHIIVLTVDGRVWAAGRGENGQIGAANTGFQSVWKELEILVGDRKAKKVFAGGWGTFIRFSGNGE